MLNIPPPQKWCVNPTDGTQNQRIEIRIHLQKKKIIPLPSCTETSPSDRGWNIFSFVWLCYLFLVKGLPLSILLAGCQKKLHIWPHYKSRKLLTRFFLPNSRSFLRHLKQFYLRFENSRRIEVFIWSGGSMDGCHLQLRIPSKSSFNCHQSIHYWSLDHFQMVSIESQFLLESVLPVDKRTQSEVEDHQQCESWNWEDSWTPFHALLYRVHILD